MNARALPSWIYDTLFRMFPHRAPTGLVRIGKPGPDSPVLVTGNFTLTVRRVVEAADGEDAWLLVANSNGINVWCAAGGGHLTHHDVISVIRTSGSAQHGQPAGTSVVARLDELEGADRRRLDQLIRGNAPGTTVAPLASAPRARNSGFIQPTPTPSSRRPPESSCTVAIAFAVGSAGR